MVKCVELIDKRKRTGEELGEDAAEGPHVDAGAIGHTQDHFGGAVAAGLLVGD